MEIIRFSASAIAGAGRGKKMGVPTINVNLAAVPESLDEGIFAAVVHIDGTDYPSAMHYGPRPVFDGSRACEVHLIDETCPDVSRVIDISVIKRIRSIENFPSVDALVEQIQADIDKCRAILASYAQSD